MTDLLAALLTLSVLLSQAIAVLHTKTQAPSAD